MSQPIRVSCSTIVILLDLIHITTITIITDPTTIIQIIMDIIVPSTIPDIEIIRMLYRLLLFQDADGLFVR